MTKRKITYAVLALLTLGFAACSQEEDARHGGYVLSAVNEYQGL